MDWNAIRRRGEQGMLTADETDALVKLARLEMKRRREETCGLDVCGYCWTREHCLPGCPIRVLEEVSDANHD